MSTYSETPTPLPSPLKRIQVRLQALGKSCVGGNGRFVIQCPAHDDHSPSGSLKEVTPDGDVLAHCYAGCTFDEIRNALGLPASAFFAHSDGSGGSDGSDRRDNGNDSAGVRKAVATYSYRNLLGVEVSQVVRTEPKGFFQRSPDGRGGYISSVKNVEKILYGLPELTAGIAAGKTVFVVEGEKDADAVSALGFVATTNPGGAGKWSDHYSETLVGAEVVILPDNDESGRRHALAVAKSLHGKAANVRVLCLPGLPEKGDVSDWIRAGGAAEQLVSLAAAAPVWGPAASSAPSSEPVEWTGIQSISAADLRTRVIEPVTFIVERFLTPGLTLLVGRPKAGKSFLSLDFGIAVATGTNALGTLSVVPGTVHYMALEDSYTRLQRRLAFFGTWPERLHLATEMRPLDRGGVEDIRRWLDEYADPKLLVIDTFGHVRPAGKRNENPYDADVKALSPLQKIGLEYDLCVLLIHHSRKAHSDDPLEMVSGTTGITGTADTTIILTRPRQEHEGKLFVTGRDVEEQEWALKFDSGRWTLLGSSAEVQNNPLRQAILDVVRQAPDGLTITAIVNEIKEANPEMPGVNYDNVKQRVYDLRKANALVQRDGKRWCLAGSAEPIVTVRKQAVGSPAATSGSEEPTGEEAGDGTIGTSGTITPPDDGVALGTRESAGVSLTAENGEEPAAEFENGTTGTSGTAGRSDDDVALGSRELFATYIEEVSGTVGTPGTNTNPKADAAIGAEKPIATVIEEVFGTTESREP
jgi:AAA domain